MKLESLNNSNFEKFEKFEINDLYKIRGGQTTARQDSTDISYNEKNGDVCKHDGDDGCYWSSAKNDGCDIA
jgi:hypothetical protein